MLMAAAHFALRFPSSAPLKSYLKSPPIASAKRLAWLSIRREGSFGTYCSLTYSALAWRKTGTSGSASFPKREEVLVRLARTIVVSGHWLWPAPIAGVLAKRQTCPG